MQNMTHPHDSRPLGFWLRTLDRLIAREFLTAYDDEGITRREWMILNVLDGTVAPPHLLARVQRGGKKVRALAARGWVSESDGTWTITDEGRAAKARLSEAVDGIRSKVAAAVSPEDFATTVASLEAMAHSLGADTPHPGHPRRGHHPYGPHPHGHHRPGHHRRRPC